MAKPTKAKSFTRLEIVLASLILTILVVFTATQLIGPSKIDTQPQKAIAEQEQSPLLLSRQELGANSATVATVEVDGKSYTFRSNGIGLFPRISIPEHAQVRIALKVNPRETIEEQVLDGGALDSRTNYQRQSSDASGSIALRYKATASPGSSRVAIYRSGNREIFDFWVDRSLATEK